MTDPEPPDQQEDQQAGEPSQTSETPEYDRLVKELGDPFDRKEPFPVPEFSDLFGSYKPLGIKDSDMIVRVDPIPTPDTSFLDVTLEQVLAEAEQNRQRPQVEASSGRLSQDSGNRKSRRSRRPKAITAGK